MFSIDDLDAEKAGDKGFEFEFLRSDGNGTGVFLTVLGGQSEKVMTLVNKLVNERRRREAAREISQRVGTGAKAVTFEPMESDVEFGQRLAAVRLVAWRGISDAWSEESALKLCRGNRELAAQVMRASDATENFIKL